MLRRTRSTLARGALAAVRSCAWLIPGAFDRWSFIVWLFVGAGLTEVGDALGMSRGVSGPIAAVLAFALVAGTIVVRRTRSRHVRL